jgi:hypothetical protein
MPPSKTLLRPMYDPMEIQDVQTHPLLAQEHHMPVRLVGV